MEEDEIRKSTLFFILQNNAWSSFEDKLESKIIIQLVRTIRTYLALFHSGQTIFVFDKVVSLFFFLKYCIFVCTIWVYKVFYISILISGGMICPKPGWPVKGMLTRLLFIVCQFFCHIGWNLDGEKTLVKFDFIPIPIWLVKGTQKSDFLC